jgi:hypothetical protein
MAHLQRRPPPPHPRREKSSPHSSPIPRDAGLHRRIGLCLLRYAPSALRERLLRMNLLNKWPRLVLSPATGGHEGSQALQPRPSPPLRNESRREMRVSLEQGAVTPRRNLSGQVLAAQGHCEPMGSIGEKCRLVFCPRNKLTLRGGPSAHPARREEGAYPLADIQPTSNAAGWDASVPECGRICGTGH